jgi:hypothetical protein
MERRRKKVVSEETAPVVSDSSRRMGNPAFIASLIMATVAVFVAAVFIGKSDSGEIDVSAAIQSSNQSGVDAEGNPVGQVNASTDAFRDMPNGGLVAQEQQPATPPPEVPAETSSSTDAASSTPEAAAEGAVEGESGTEEDGDATNQPANENQDGQQQ